MDALQKQEDEEAQKWLKSQTKAVKFDNDDRLSNTLKSIKRKQSTLSSAQHVFTLYILSDKKKETLGTQAGVLVLSAHAKDPKIQTLVSYLQNWASKKLSENIELRQVNTQAPALNVEGEDMIDLLYILRFLGCDDVNFTYDPSREWANNYLGLLNRQFFLVKQNEKKMKIKIPPVKEKDTVWMKIVPSIVRFIFKYGSSIDKFYDRVYKNCRQLPRALKVRTAPRLNLKSHNLNLMLSVLTQEEQRVVFYPFLERCKNKKIKALVRNVPSDENKLEDADEDSDQDKKSKEEFFAYEELSYDQSSSALEKLKISMKNGFRRLKVEPDNKMALAYVKELSELIFSTVNKPTLKTIYSRVKARQRLINKNRPQEEEKKNNDDLSRRKKRPKKIKITLPMIWSEVINGKGWPKQVVPIALMIQASVKSTSTLSQLLPILDNGSTFVKLNESYMLNDHAYSVIKKNFFNSLNRMGQLALQSYEQKRKLQNMGNQQMFPQNPGIGSYLLPPNQSNQSQSLLNAPQSEYNDFLFNEELQDVNSKVYAQQKGANNSRNKKTKKKGG